MERHNWLCRLLKNHKWKKSSSPGLWGSTRFNCARRGCKAFKREHAK